MSAAEPAEEPPQVERGTKGQAVLSDDGSWHFCVVTKVRETPSWPKSWANFSLL
jgi:hypothetical protein